MWSPQIPTCLPSFLFKGNVIKATSILHKAQAMNAKPAQLLEMAIRNLKTGAKQLVPTRDEEKEPSSGTDLLSPPMEALSVSDVMFHFHCLPSEFENRFTGHFSHCWGKPGSACSCSDPCEPASGTA